MEAVCQVCKSKVESEYIVTNDHVELVRHCPADGDSSTVVSRDIDYFKRCLELAEQGLNSRRGLIVELLDGCNIECPTCIASSSPDLQNLRTPEAVASRLQAIKVGSNSSAIFLSGGEPTIHPQLGNFVSVVEATDVSRRILISNGLRIASGNGFARELRETMSRPWEVFLQFDSLRPAVLRNIRGANLVGTRLKSADALESAGIRTTLVCVVKYDLNLDEVGEIIDFARTKKNVVGVQLQPIREAGRLGNYESARDACDLDVVRQELVKSVGAKALQPHPQSPLSVSVAMMRKSTGDWLCDADALDLSPDFYVEEPSTDRDLLRIGIVEYSDLHNWSTLKSSTSPIDVLLDNGSTVSVDDYFLDV